LLKKTEINLLQLVSALIAKPYSNHAGCAALAIKSEKKAFIAPLFDYSTGVLWSCGVRRFSDQASYSVNSDHGLRPAPK
jgi:hypothetical protein